MTVTRESPLPIKHLNHIQALRGIAALLVVLSHLLITERKYSADQILGDWAVYGMVGVDLFFVISGFIMVYVMWDRPRGLKAAGEFLWGRAARIYPLYWIISAVLLALWLLRPDMVFSSIDAPPDIVKSFALFPHEREPLLAVGWTLVHEMYFYLIFAGIMLLPRGALAPALVLWALIIFIVNAYENIIGAGGAATQLIFSYLTLEFIAGAAAACIFKVRRRGMKASKLSMLSIVLLILGVLKIALSALHGDAFPSEHLARIDDFLFPAVFIVYALAAFDWSGRKVWKPLVILGDWSYSLYLTHVLSLTVMGRVWANFSSESRLDNIIVLLGMTALTIFISGLVYNYIEAPIIKAARKASGRLFQ